MQFVAGMNIGNVHLDERSFEGLERIDQGNGGEGVGSGVHDQGIGLGAGRLNQIDQNSLVIGLVKLERDAQPLCKFAAARLDRRQRGGPVNVGLTHAQEIEIGPVEDHQPCCHRWLL